MRSTITCSIQLGHLATVFATEIAECTLTFLLFGLLQFVAIKGINGVPMYITVTVILFIGVAGSADIVVLYIIAYETLAVAALN